MTASASAPSGASSIDISIIILNWNTRDLLAQCLESVGNRGQRSEVGSQTSDFRPPTSNNQLETFVVDNASSDGSPEMVAERFPWVRLVRNSDNVGFARGNNQAMALAQGRYILLLNSDAQLTPGALEAMTGHLDSDSRAGIASVCQVYPDGRPQFCYGRFPTLWREARTLFGLHQWDLRPLSSLTAPMEVDWVSGACMMIRREVLDRIGLLDESFFMFGEEVDLCYRTTQAGWRVRLVPSQPVIHVQAGSSGQTAQRMLRLYRGKLRYAAKHWRRWRGNALRSMMALSATIKVVSFSIASLVRPQLTPKRRLWQEITREIYRGALHDAI